MSGNAEPIRVALVATPDVLASSFGGIWEVLTTFTEFGEFERAPPVPNPFRAEIVAPTPGTIRLASGLRVESHRTIVDVGTTDVVIVPSLMMASGEWVPGRYRTLVRWLSEMHGAGAMLCSACSGALLLAETGLLDGLDATVHWAYARTFRRNFPRVRLRLDKALLTTGSRQEFVMSGASASWHDLVLYLVAREVGPMAARAVARFLLLQWHEEGQAPYVVFEEPTDHGDAAVLAVQVWLRRNYAVAAPVDQMVDRSGLAERTFKRRFKKATGETPIRYVQHLRVEEAKRRLEGTSEPIEEIAWSVGYEDAASFRRLFKRVTRMPPGAYRRRFGMEGLSAMARAGG